ncbi:hypothetical protein TNCV_1367291 [Trichonephila clavipes]|nr:hypothetical protein TNCV_1367291 [Trichonephila clavipes]
MPHNALTHENLELGVAKHGAIYMITVQCVPPPNSSGTPRSTRATLSEAMRSRILKLIFVVVSTRSVEVNIIGADRAIGVQEESSQGAPPEAK